MNPFRDWSARAVCLVTGVGLGWLLFSPGPGGSGTVADRPGQGLPAMSAATAVRSRPPGSAAQEPGVGGSQALSVEARVRSRFEAFMRDPNDRKRLGGFLTGLNTLTAEEAPALLNLIDQLNREGIQLPMEWSAFTRRWGEVDGAAAAAHALSRSGEPWVHSGLRSIFAGWGSTDPDGAAKWLNEHSDSPEFDSALGGLIGGLAETDPAAATAAALASLPEGNRPSASRAMEVIAEAVVRQKNVGGVVEWYGTLPEDSGPASLRNAAFGHVWWRLQTSDLNQAADWLSSEADKPWRNDRQYGETTELLARDNPAGALDWAGSLPPSPTTGQWPGVDSTLQQWASSDPAAAAAWVQTQPDSPFGNHVRAAISAPGQ